MSEHLYTPGCFGFPAQELWTEPLQLMASETEEQATDRQAQYRLNLMVQAGIENIHGGAYNDGMMILDAYERLRSAA